MRSLPWLPLVLLLLAMAYPGHAQFGHKRILIYVLSDRYDDNTWVNWYQNPLHLYHIATNLTARGYQVEAIDRAIHTTLPTNALASFSQVWLSECDADGTVDVSPEEAGALADFKRQGGGVWISLEGTLPGENWIEDGMAYAAPLGATWLGNHYGPSTRTVAPSSHPLLNGVAWLKFDGEVGRLGSTNSSLVSLWEYTADHSGILADEGTPASAGRLVVDAGWLLGYCWFDTPTQDSHGRGNMRFLNQLADWLEPLRPGTTPLPDRPGWSSLPGSVLADVSLAPNGVLAFDFLTPTPGIRYTIEGTSDFLSWITLAHFIADTGATRVTNTISLGDARFFRVRADSASPSFLRFPLLSANPYNALVTAIQDHAPENGVVVAYNGERADAPATRVERPDGAGYGRSPAANFSLPLLNYDDGVGSSPANTHLFSDGHPGYDYPRPQGHVIVAAASGRLFPAIEAGARTGDGTSIWRNDQAFPRIEGAAYTWPQDHAFYIVHENGYSTWYRHARSQDPLTPEVRAALIAQGFATVSRGQPVGYVGSHGAFTSHLHFEVRRHGPPTPGATLLPSTTVDPYGNGDADITDILWEEPPPAGSATPPPPGS